MPLWAQLLTGIGGGLLLIWLILVGAMLWSGRGLAQTTTTLRMLPDIVRLVSRLARDKSLPRGVRVRLWLLLAYLASPIDLIPDFVPVLGYADDAIIVAITMRAVVRRAGAQAIEKHWPGTPEGLELVHRLAGTGNRRSR